MRAWEQKSQSRTDAYLCNSQYVRERIRRIYKRDALVVYPPVDTDRFQPQARNQREGYYLYLGALVPYKRPDVAVEAFSKMGLPLVVAGTGPEEESLKARAKSNVVFKGAVDDDEIPRLYANAKAFIFPGEEDFGITPLEAQASGTPVIALGRGGALETVKPFGEEDAGTGLFFHESSVVALEQAVLKFEKNRLDERMSVEALQEWASKFDTFAFSLNLRSAITQVCPPHLVEGVSKLFDNSLK